MLKAGDKAPAIKLSDQSGNTVKLTDFKGRKVLVYFYPKAETPRAVSRRVGRTANPSRRAVRTDRSIVSATPMPEMANVANCFAAT